jgi:hypothetical protein
MREVVMPDKPFQEVWWIYSPVNGVSWAGLRIAYFQKASNTGELLVCITNETDHRRMGLRTWTDIIAKEQWYKVKRIDIPTSLEIITAALEGT